MRRALALVVSVAFAAPGLAHGATAEVVSGQPFFSGEFFFYTAAPGETNQVDLGITGDTITVHDSGASITAGDGCTPVDAHEVTCTITLIDGLHADLDDLDDTLTLAGDPFGWQVKGGSGADTLLDSCATGCGFLFGGPGSDTLQGRNLIGGGGEDGLTGTASRDGLGGGAGNDTLGGLGGNDLLGPGPGDDSVDGGAGVDVVSFSAHPPTGVSADLRTGIATGDGTDALTSIEGLFGSQEDDHLGGDSHANRFNGFGGADVILGRGGDDQLAGECCRDGNDRLSGGPGDDRLSGGGGDDVLRGGTGKDSLRGQAGRDRLHAKDGFRDVVRGGGGVDWARVDRALDLLRDVEKVFF
jgi:Ca2+-binding RTX toxin-like protein